MHSDSKQLRRTLLCHIGINAVLYGYRIDIAPSTTAVTPYEFSVTPYECQMYHFDMFAISFLVLVSLVCTLTVNNSEEPYSASLISMQYSMGIAAISL